MSALLLLAGWDQEEPSKADPHGYEMAAITYAYNQKIEPFKLSTHYVQKVRIKMSVNNLLQSMGLKGLDFTETIEKLKNGYIESDTGIGHFPIDKSKKKYPDYPDITDVYIENLEYLARNKVNRRFLTSDSGTRDTQVKRARAVLRLLEKKQG